MVTKAMMFHVTTLRLRLLLGNGASRLFSTAKASTVQQLQNTKKVQDKIQNIKGWIY